MVIAMIILVCYAIVALYSKHKLKKRLSDNEKYLKSAKRYHQFAEINKADGNVEMAQEMNKFAQQQLNKVKL